ncbi:VSP [Giardia lamblia P15]|uniref:VSP n=1 Tax=Giardia intestinalis (strain P15) TaxID=658858 RepID=E1F1Z6_GIAIA|nr:VSP [Giardia lamblia P15]
MLLIAFYFVLNALAANCKGDGSQHTVCAEGKCDMIGNIEVCTQCKTSGNVPIDGVCKAVAEAANKCTKDNDNPVDNQDTTCGKCTNAYFMYKGGCYGTTSAPGNKMCKTAADGVCTAAVDTKEYTTIPTADRDATKQSVIPCGSIEEVTVKENKKYKGVAHCTKCREPAKNNSDTAVAAVCETCEDGFFDAACTACHDSCKTCEAAGEDKCKSCKDGYFLGATSNAAGKCIQCNSKTESNWPGVDNCAKCTSSNTQNTPATCTECMAEFYLKPAVDVTPPSCVAETGCGEGFFPATVDKVKKCVACNAKDNGGIEDCKKCSFKTSSANAAPILACTECNTKWLSPVGDACLEDCPAGTHPHDGQVCPSCHNTCAECSGNADATSCTACYPGFVLKRGENGNMGTCIPECTGKYVENCEANQCTAVVGGSKYCSKCKTGFVPVDGICVSIASRAVIGCTPGNGVCTACTDSYFLQSGGCYRSTAFPGNKLCTLANNGKCTRCANGQTADNSSGSCPACDSTCKTCTAKEDPNACSACFPGYYKSGTKCVACDKSDGTINGVENCSSCKEPTGPSGTVTCYVKNDGTSGGGDSGSGGGSTNKSGLSTGAIAGIAVAAIVVVGGLVGFLCWWFICRGKA